MLVMLTASYVLQRISSPRCISKDMNKTCITSTSTTGSCLLFSFPMVTLLVFSSSVLLLSFFSVDGLQRTDLKWRELQNVSGIPTMMFSVSRNDDYWHGGGGSSSSSSSSTERTIGAETILLRKDAVVGKSGQHQHFHGRLNRRDKRKGNSEAHHRNEGSSGDKERRKLIGQTSEDWDLVTIVDENEFEDEIDAGRTRINILPESRHVSSFLNRGMIGRFLFLNKKLNNPLSILVTPCNSILAWSIKVLPLIGNTTKVSVSLKNNSRTLETFRTQRSISYKKSRSNLGVYMVEIRPIYSDTFVHLFVTTSHDYTDPFNLDLSPQDSLIQNDTSNDQGKSYSYNFLNMNQKSQKPWVGVKRLRGNRIQVKWDTSHINPHLIHYCIVVNTRRDYNSLCGALGDKYGFLPPDLRDLPMYPFYPPQQSSEASEFLTSATDMDNDVVPRTNNQLNEILVGCLKRKTNYILTDLLEGRLYYFNVFIKDTTTGLSYPYVRTTLKYQTPKQRPNHLRDGKSFKVRLQPLKTVTLKFNINKPCTELSFYIMPCGGGAISYKILTTNHTLYEETMVDSLDMIKMAFPLRGKYFVTVSQAWEGEGQGLARMAEVYVSKKQKKFPLPKLPATTKIWEVESKRACDEVTVQWWASPDFRDNEYCFFLKEETRKQGFHFKKPNQCDLERSLQNDPYVTHSFCVQKNPTENDENLLSQRISGLQPLHVYVLQLILRRHNGKSLSYDLTYVTTIQKCDEK